MAHAGQPGAQMGNQLSRGAALRATPPDLPAPPPATPLRSSIIESWPSATSPSSASRLWPYSMAGGIPQNWCAALPPPLPPPPPWLSPAPSRAAGQHSHLPAAHRTPTPLATLFARSTGSQWMAPSTCNATERYAGLFEVPLQQWLTGPVTNGIAKALSTMVRLACMAGGPLGAVVVLGAFLLPGPAQVLCPHAASCPPLHPAPAQDPTADTEAALLAQLREQFSYSYNGNRAPWTIALHTPWCAPALAV